MPWSYNSIDYQGSKIGSIFGLLTFMSEYRNLNDEQKEDLGKLKQSYYLNKYITPADIKMVFAMIEDTKQLKKKQAKTKKKPPTKPKVKP
jgi:hypothetical protein|tara:strand:- start:491 stop:760 length:270 start_codon:yes stop_codon:yes gene_type:complete